MLPVYFSEASWNSFLLVISYQLPQYLVICVLFLNPCLYHHICIIARGRLHYVSIHIEFRNSEFKSSLWFSSVDFLHTHTFFVVFFRAAPSSFRISCLRKTPTDRQLHPHTPRSSTSHRYICGKSADHRIPYFRLGREFFTDIFPLSAFIAIDFILFHEYTWVRCPENRVATEEALFVCKE